MEGRVWVERVRSKSGGSGIDGMGGDGEILQEMNR